MYYKTVYLQMSMNVATKTVDLMRTATILKAVTTVNAGKGSLEVMVVTA